jgi:hypothetical protein
MSEATALKQMDIHKETKIGIYLDDQGVFQIGKMNKEGRLPPHKVQYCTDISHAYKIWGKLIAAKGCVPDGGNEGAMSYVRIMLETYEKLQAVLEAPQGGGRG